MEIIKLKDKNIKLEKRFSKKAKNINLKIVNEVLFLTIPYPMFFQSKKSLEKKAMDFLYSKENWILKHIQKKQIDKNLLIDSREHYLKHKEQVYTLCSYKTKYWAEKMWVKYNKISIKKLKTKWWSCSSKKNLNFNYKIIFLPEKEQDYLIVHELSHLIHMNHSKEFWDLVCKTLKSKEFRRYKI